MRSIVKKSLSLIFVMVLVSCGSQEKTVEKQPEPKFPEGWEQEFEAIENADFKETVPLDYIPSQDQFPTEVHEADSLAKESAQRLPEPKLEVLEKSGDPINQSASLCYRKDFERANKTFDENYSKYKEHPSYWVQIGTCFLLQGKRELALLYYNRARDLDKNYIPAVNNIGVIYLVEKKFQKALKAFETAFKANSFSLTPAFNIGILYLKFGFVDKAESIFISLRKKNQSDVDVAHALAHVYLVKGDYSKSLAYFKIMPKERISDPRVGLGYAVALKAANRPKDASKVFGIVDISVYPDMRNYYQNVSSYLNGRF